MMPSRRAKKRMVFVPQGLFVGALATASVIPVCACGGSTASSGDAGIHDAHFTPGADVAAHAFGDVHSVAMRAFDGGSEGGPTDAMLVGDVAIAAFDGSAGVAADAFGGSDAPTDATRTDGG